MQIVTVSSIFDLCYLSWIVWVDSITFYISMSTILEHLENMQVRALMNKLSKEAIAFMKQLAFEWYVVLFRSLVSMKGF